MPSRFSPLNRTIVRLAIPTILMNISTPLLGAVDTAVVGHLPEVYYVGAVGLGSLLFTMIYWTVGFFRMSTVGLTAQSHRRGDEQECVDVLGRALLLAITLGLLVIAARGLITWVAFQAFDATTAVEHHAEIYFNIRIFAAPAAFVLLIFQGWYYGVKNVAYPVLLTIFVNVLNIGLDFLFVVRWGYKSDGVAWATVISQYLGIVMAIGLFWYKYPHYWRRFILLRVFSWPQLRLILMLNMDIFLRTLSLQIATLYFMAKSAAMGELILAANTILLQMRYIAAYALDGFATAAEVTVGSAIGAEDREELLAAVRISLCWGMIVGGIISAVYFALSPWWPSWYTNNAAVLSLVNGYLVWIVLEPWISNLAFILDGVYVGATASRLMRNAMIFSVIAVFLPAIHLLSWLYGNHGMWAATVLLYFARTITLALPLRRLWRGSGVRLV